MRNFRKAKILNFFIIICFLFNTFSSSAALAFTPNLPLQFPNLRYLSINSANPNNYFNFLMDAPPFEKGGNGGILNQEARKLINYFFLGISLPEDSFWVNLKPQEQDRLTSAELSRTDMGKILLEQDLLLKKTVAKLLHPDHPKGKEFWTKLYKELSATKETVSQARKLFPLKLSENGVKETVSEQNKETVSDPINLKKLKIETNNRVWIVPDKATVVETFDGAFISEATLKVLLENEYLEKSDVGAHCNVPLQTGSKENIAAISESLMKQIILPELNNEVNASAQFAPLRQIYYSLILASYFKNKVIPSPLRGGPERRESLNPYTALINSHATQDLESSTPWSKDALYQEYLVSYSKGEYNLRRDLFGLARMYFSGGIGLSVISIGPAKNLNIITDDVFESLPFIDDVDNFRLIMKKGVNPADMQIAVVGPTSSPLKLSQVISNLNGTFWNQYVSDRWTKCSAHIDSYLHEDFYKKWPDQNKKVHLEVRSHKKRGDYFAYFIFYYPSSLKEKDGKKFLKDALLELQTYEKRTGNIIASAIKTKFASMLYKSKITRKQPVVSSAIIHQRQSPESDFPLPNPSRKGEGITENVAGIDLNAIKVELKDYASSPLTEQKATIAKIKTLLCVDDLFNKKWASLAHLHFQELAVMVKDGIVSSAAIIAEKDKLLNVATELKAQGYLTDQQGLEFLNLLR